MNEDCFRGGLWESLGASCPSAAVPSLPNCQLRETQPAQIPLPLGPQGGRPPGWPSWPPCQFPLGLHLILVPRRACHNVGGWRGPTGGWGCCNSEEPHLPLPLTALSARSLEHFPIHKQGQLQHETAGGSLHSAGCLLSRRRSLAPAPVPHLAFGRLRVPSNPVPS